MSGESAIREAPGRRASAQRIYEEALRARQHQDDRLEALRGRAALVFTAAAIALTLFAGDQRPTTGWLVILGSLFGVLLWCVAAVVMPRRWEEAPGVSDLVTWYLDDSEAPDETVLLRDLALLHEHLWEKNEPALRRVKGWFAGAVCTLGLMVLALVLNGAGTP